MQVFSLLLYSLLCLLSAPEPKAPLVTTLAALPLGKASTGFFIL